MADHSRTPMRRHRTGPLLTIQHQRRGPAVLLRLTGEIDLSSADVMRRALAAALTDATPPHPIVLDLNGVGFLGSRGLNQLVEANRNATDQHTPLRVVATSRSVLRPLEVTGIIATLDVRADLAAALPPQDSVPQQRIR